MTTFDRQIQTLWGDFAQQRLQALADRYGVRAGVRAGEYALSRPEHRGRKLLIAAPLILTIFVGPTWRLLL